MKNHTSEIWIFWKNEQIKNFKNIIFGLPDIDLLEGSQNQEALMWLSWRKCTPNKLFRMLHSSPNICLPNTSKQAEVYSLFRPNVCPNNCKVCPNNCESILIFSKHICPNVFANMFGQTKVNSSPYRTTRPAGKIKIKNRSYEANYLNQKLQSYF